MAKSLYKDIDLEVETEIKSRLEDRVGYLKTKVGTENKSREESFYNKYGHDWKERYLKKDRK